jgi:hypothetical protein
MLKQPTLAFLLIIFIGIISVFLEGQNSVTIEGDNKCDSIDSTLFRKLAILVNENRFSRQYYEVKYYNHNKDCSSYVLNYNTKYQLLSLSSDPCSGFGGYAKVSKEELFKIANNYKIKIDNFYQFYKSEFPKDYGRLPTKACSFSLF